MATTEQKKSFINMCANIIRDNYEGNPLALQSFLDKINLIQDLTDDNLNTTFIAFLKSKLEGKAREALPENINTIEDIKNALRSKIRPENSKVIAGKIAALQIRNDNFTVFAKKTEELADALERSLVIKGMTKTKAHEMAIEQTVSICRLNARSTLVKSILASTTFSDPKDVIAKLIVEQTNESNEKQVLSVQARFNNYNNSSRNNNMNRFNYNDRFNINSSNRGNSYRRYNGSSRGFTNYRNNGNNNYRRNNNTSRGNTSHNNNSNSNRTTRARALNLNAEDPQQEMLGDVNCD